MQKLIKYGVGVENHREILFVLVNSEKILMFTFTDNSLIVIVHVFISRGLRNDSGKIEIKKLLSIVSPVKAKMANNVPSILDINEATVTI